MSFIWFLLFALPFVVASPRYSTWLADSAISRGQGNGIVNGSPGVSYEHGTFQRALTALYSLTGNKTYFNYIQSGIDTVVSSNGSVAGYAITQYTLDNLRLGESFVQLANITKASKYKAAADLFRKQLETHPRNNAGGFWHKQIYPFQMWGDGQYMGLPFYAAYTTSYQPTNVSAWNDIAMQIALYHSNNVVPSSSAHAVGMTYHGYDESKKAVWANPTTGASPEVWDRADGWYAMALVDLLDYFPTTHPGRAQILSTFQSFAPSILASVDPTSGAWWLVITQPGRSGNYIESSGSAMFIYALLKGLRMGYIKDSGGKYTTALKKAYGYLTSNFVKDDGNGLANLLNTVSVGSLSGAGDYNYYISQTVTTNDLKGVSAMVLASVEYERAFGKP